MVLNILIFSILLLLLFFRYKEGVILITVLSPWLFMWKFPVGQTLNLYVALSCVAIILLLRNEQLKYSRNFPFIWTIIFPFISFSVTAVFVKFKIVPLLELLSSYIFPFALFSVIREKEDINLFLKYLSIFLLFVVSYTFIEELTSSNPIMDWCVRHKQQFGWIASTNQYRFGIKRAQSFLLYCSALGGLCNYSFFIIAYLRSKNVEFTKTPLFTFLLYALPLCTFLTGTRSVIIAFIIICICFINYNIVRRYKFTLLFIATIAFFMFQPYLSKIGNSIIASDDVNNRIGSSVEMRETQFAVATYYMLRAKSPWYGNGLDFTDKVKQDNWEILGAESIWLPRMIDQGYIGVICLAISYVIMLLILIKYKMYACFWVMLSFIFGKTVSAMLGMVEGYYLLVFVIIYRYLQITHHLPSNLLDKRTMLKKLFNRNKLKETLQ